MKKSDLIITILGLCGITFISIILTLFLNLEKYGTSIVYFDIIVIVIWTFLIL